eukprot:10523644-Lingulodinium_polyedra.AAC.1
MLAGSLFHRTDGPGSPEWREEVVIPPAAVARARTFMPGHSCRRQFAPARDTRQAPAARWRGVGVH